MFKIDEYSQTPIYQQIVDRVKEYSLKGIFESGEKLPSVRELSKELRVNPNTVQKAYRELDLLGITVSSKGRGRFIAEDINWSKDIGDLKEVKASIKRELIELSYMGYKDGEILELIEEILEDLGRDKDD